jgi:hypothetical protein
VAHPASSPSDGRIRRLTVQVTILAILIAAFVTSFKSGSDGARILGFPPEFLFTAPLICDIVAGLATLVHGWARDDEPMRWLATWFVMGPMMLSWSANAVDHVGRAPVDPAWPATGQWAWLAGVIVFSGLCPAAVAGLLFFSTKFTEFEQRQAERAPKVPVETVAAEDEPEFVEPPPILAVRAAVNPPSEIEVDDELVDEINEIEIERVMRDEKVPRDIAEIMIREDVSRATAYRRAKGKRDAALA